ncbi:dipeptidase [Thermodesulfobacteriota bacterium]
MQINGRVMTVGIPALMFVSVVFSGSALADVEEDVLGRARSLHQEAFVADLHADPLIWNRDLNRRTKKGHIDFPRLREAGVDLQVCGLPTYGPPFKSAFRIVCWLQGWPREARKNPVARANWMIDQLERFIEESDGSVLLVRDPDEMEYNRSMGILSTMLVIEGGQVLDGRVENLDTFFQRGVRGIGLTHFVPNDLGGGSFKKADRDRGLTDLGRKIIGHANDLGIIVDLAHASEATVLDILDTSRAPMMFSHTGLHAVHDHWRNISDDVVAKVAGKGGIIGVIFQTGYLSDKIDGFLGGNSIDDLVDHIMHVVDLAGPEHVAYGSDFDGGINPPRGMKDVTDLPLVTAALLERGLPEEDVRLILGGNFRRLFRQVWEARRMD